jgi:hypothetical protein
MSNNTPILAIVGTTDIKQHVQRIVAYFVDVFEQLNTLKDQVINSLFADHLQGKTVKPPPNPELLKMIVKQLTPQIG